MAEWCPKHERAVAEWCPDCARKADVDPRIAEIRAAFARLKTGEFDSDYEHFQVGPWVDTFGFEHVSGDAPGGVWIGPDDVQLLLDRIAELEGES